MGEEIVLRISELNSSMILIFNSSSQVIVIVIMIDFYIYFTVQRPPVEGSSGLLLGSWLLKLYMNIMEARKWKK